MMNDHLRKVLEMNVRRLESAKRLILLILSGICLVMETLIFYYFWKSNFSPSITAATGTVYYYRADLLQVGFYFAMLFFFSNMYGGLKIGYLKNVEVIFSQSFATLGVTILLYAQLSLLAKQFFVPHCFVYMLLLDFLVIVLWNNIAYWIYKSIFPPRKMLLVHGDRPIDNIQKKFDSRKDKYKIEKYVHINQGVEKIKEMIRQGVSDGEFQAVVIWDISTSVRNQIFKYCYANSIRVYMMPKITDVLTIGMEELHLFDTPILMTREYRLTLEQRFLKRTYDLIFSLLLLILASPIMLITAIVIKCYDKGPVLYKQVRCTEGQREFYIMKFRSMRIDAEKDGVARLASKNDDRITPIGKFIRKVRIDELPQLINILKGDMSFIGPRPERPEIIAKYMEVMPEFAYRMQVKAGLAGYAQVYGKYNTTPYDKLKLDLTYIEHYSFWLDIQLSLLTLKILFWPDSTEGVDNDQITALMEEIRKQKEENGEE